MGNQFSNIPQESLDSSIYLLKKNTKKDESNAQFVTVNKKSLPKFAKGSCHAGLVHRGMLQRDTLGVLTQVRKKNSLESIDFRWWLANYSPYKDAYLSKDRDWILENGLLVDLSVPAGLAQGANILARCPNEFRSKVDMWNTMVSSYLVDPFDAFVCMFGLRMEDENNFVFHDWANHCPTRGWRVSKSGIERMRNGDTSFGKTKTILTHGIYGNVENFFGPITKSVGSNKVINTLKDRFRQDGKFTVSEINPFGSLVQDIFDQEVVRFRKEDSLGIAETVMEVLTSG